MKRSLYIILLAVVALLSGCRQADPATPVADPNWKLADHPECSVSMTAVIALPDNLGAYLAEGDRMAALVGDDVRGVALLSDSLFFLQVIGSDAETVDFRIRYWSARTGFLYESAEAYPFRQDEILGSPDEPYSVNFVVR